MTIEQEEALEYMQTLAIRQGMNVDNANKVVAFVRKQNKENTKLKMEKLLLKTVMKKIKLCGICKNYEQEDCRCSFCGENVNIWETCEKWEFLGMEDLR